MKKSLLILVPFLLLGGCMPTKKGTSTTNPTPGNTEQSGASASSAASSSSSGASSSSSSSNSSGSSSSSEIIPPPVLEKQTISEIKAAAKVGELVKFDATYLAKLSWTNENMMYFADAHDTICLRVPQTVTHFNNRNINKEYTVTARLALDTTNDVLEVQYDSQEVGVDNTLVNFPDTYPTSFSYETTSIRDCETVEGLMNYTHNINLNKKYHGYGDIVKFTAQAVQTEYSQSNSKVMVHDGNGHSTVVIGRGEKKVIEKTDIGKYYTWYGIVSFLKGVPAIYDLKHEYISHTAEEEANLNVSVENTTAFTCADLAKWRMKSDDEVPPGNDNTYKIFCIEGYVANNDMNEKYYLGLVDNLGDKIKFDNVTPYPKAFYFVNGTNLDDKDEFVGKIADYYNNDIKIRVFVKMQQYWNDQHAWKMFCVESLIQAVS